MKKMLCISLLAVTLIAPVSYADDSVCSSIANLANMVMTNRQAGVPLTKMIELTEAGAKKEVQKFIKRIIIRAYDHPRYYGATWQHRVIIDFENEIYLECIKQEVQDE